MIASTSTGDDAVPDVDAPTPDIGAELEPPAGIEEPAMPVAASAWPVILDQIFPKMLMDGPLSEGRTNRWLWTLDEGHMWPTAFAVKELTGPVQRDVAPAGRVASSCSPSASRASRSYAPTAARSSATATYSWSVCAT